MTEPLKPTVKRDLSLWSVQAWQRGYEIELPETLGWRYPIVFYYDGTRVNFYHRLTDFTYFKQVLTQRLINDRGLFLRLDAEFRKNILQLQALEQKLTAETIETAASLVGRVMAHYVFIVSDAFVQRVPEAWESRRQSEGILYEIDQRVEVLLKQHLTTRGLSKGIVRALTNVESARVLRDEAINIQQVEKRMSGYIVWEEEILTGTRFTDFCVQQGWEPPVEIVTNKRVTEIRGVTAFPGTAHGCVVLLHTKNDLLKVQEGDIVVSTMTNATFLPALMRASAMVTDEGGITCHAAIVAREFKKPCIIGTKTATQVLKDGDQVEVDADKGVVRILEKP